MEIRWNDTMTEDFSEKGWRMLGNLGHEKVETENKIRRQGHYNMDIGKIQGKQKKREDYICSLI